MGVNWLTHICDNRPQWVNPRTLSNVFSWMKMLQFRSKFQWSLFQRVQLIILQHWFRQWLGADQATSHYSEPRWLVYRSIYASFGLNELRSLSVCHQSTQSFITLYVIEYLKWWVVSDDIRLPTFLWNTRLRRVGAIMMPRWKVPCQNGSSINVPAWNPQLQQENTIMTSSKVT